MYFFSPPSSLRRGYDRQAGPTQWLFQGPPAESKVLAVIHHNQGRKHFISGTIHGTILAIACAAGLSHAETKAPQPNIIVILADDMGFSDIGCYGGEINTPHLDGLAKNGLRFSQFYNASRCCSTRASLLTGLYPHQAGIGNMTGDQGLPGYRGDLNRECVTLAEALRPAGYRTYMVGKWHVTATEYELAVEGSRDNWPLQRGFDRFFGTPSGGGCFFDPATLTRDNELIPPGEGFYYTDAIGENAAAFIAEHDHDHPFFMYVSFTAPHWPLHAKPRDIEKYAGRYDAGWEVLREQRYRRQVEMGIIDPNWPVSPRASEKPVLANSTAAQAWDDVEDKTYQAKLMEVYAAMVDSMDQAIGRIVAELKSSGRFENTLILFLSDNGGESQGVYLRKGVIDHPLGPDGIQLDLVPKFTRAGLPMRTGPGVLPGPADTYCAYGLPWANLSNTPFRYFKCFTHEGGIATPLIAHWPDGISRRGEWEHQPGHVIDIMATSVDLAGAEYPEHFNGHAVQPMEGRSLVPAFAGRPIQRAAPLVWEHGGNRALRDGEWKIVARRAASAWELYNLKDDRTELNNLADQHPDRVAAMAAEWKKQARRTRILPWPHGPLPE